MTRPDTAMVLAAGFGTRMGALTAETPKPLLKVAGRTLIDHALDDCTDAGVSRAIINLHYRGDQIRAYLANRTTPEIAFSEELPKILDTGGGIVQALPQLGPNPFFVLNSDAVFAGPNPLTALADAWDPAQMDALLYLIPKEEAHAYTREGDYFLDHDGGIPRHRGKEPTAPLVYTGAQIVSPSVFTDVPTGAFTMRVIWRRLIAQGRLAAIRGAGPWVDVGTPEGLGEAATVLSAENR